MVEGVEVNSFLLAELPAGYPLVRRLILKLLNGALEFLIICIAQHETALHGTIVLWRAGV